MLLNDGSVSFANKMYCSAQYTRTHIYNTWRWFPLWYIITILPILHWWDRTDCSFDATTLLAFFQKRIWVQDQQKSLHHSSEYSKSQLVQMCFCIPGTMSSLLNSYLQNHTTKHTIHFKHNITLYWVTKNRIWIDNWIYWTLADCNYN
jgi:hypothetical protein